MIDHVSVAVRDLAAATRFYEAVLATLGFAKLEDRPATVGFGKRYPEFWINLREDLAPLPADSGVHVCLRARGTDRVDAFHQAALAAGGADDGAPGLRPHHGAGYYAAFIRGPDGNRIELYTSDYMIPEPDWEPIRWSINDPRRATFWGHKPPASWFEEASLVESIETGEFMPTSPAPLRDRPEFVT